ncbi:MAG TPA: CYTH domain-containing protein [Tepidisphaeraceae bacterium]|jgi:CYTH domain-containing protein|nr:CYTH domain-containing protein [Tepidisphaeraceae bacterium]
MERERKFLVADVPAGLGKHPHKRIRQGYLAITGASEDTPVEVRVRDEDGKHVLTVKGGRGASRTEVEVPIPADAFRALWRLTQGKRIEKTRYRIRVGELTVELDVYAGKLRGLRTAEVEFDSGTQMRRFRPPEWLGREVTGRDEFGNSRLATRDAPPAVPRR